MAFTKQRFCLHYSIPLSKQDWANLDASRVKLVMLPLPFCDRDTLWELRARNCKVVIRIPESDYYQDADPIRIKDAVFAAMQFCPIEAVIVGVEPDDQYVLSYGEPTWGQERAYEHRRRFDAVRRLLQPMIKVISPGLKAAVRRTDGTVGRTISEDDPPAAGIRDWCMINTLPDKKDNTFGWDEAEGNSTHMYLYSHDGIVDDLRFMIDSKWWLTLLHKPIWMGELGLGNARSNDQDKMQAYIQIAEILLSRKNGKQHPLGQRCELLAPFVSNGIPDHWEAYYLLDDPVAYQLLGAWMSIP